MRIPKLCPFLLVLASITTGCAQTGWMRSAPTSNVRTVASVGDKPLPIVAGEPGSSVRATSDDPDVTASNGSRISGRVYDETGQPVPKAKVRLAVGSAVGGKINFATTDQSGAFTLRGLRPRTSYTLIAEYQGEDALMSGRAEVEAPHTNVSISLQPRDSVSARTNRAAVRPARPKVEPISRPEPPADDEDTDVSGSRLNLEDLDPPAADAAALLPDPADRTARRVASASTSAVKAGWSVRQPSARKGERPADDRSTAQDDRESNSPTTQSDEPAGDLDDDGPNPLPPAIEDERVGSASARAGDAPDPTPIRVVRAPARASRPRRSESPGASEPASAGRDDPSPDQEPQPIPEDILPRGRGLLAPTAAYESTIVIGADDTGRGPRQSATTARPAGAKSPARGRPAKSAPDSASIPDGDEPTAPRRRPTWRELSFQPANVPVDESVRRASGTAEDGASPLITFTGAAEPPRMFRPGLLTGTRPRLDSAVRQSVCRVDPRDQRLVDFELAGLDGGMVALHDFDADLILLDFWGSWCKECRPSSEHLRELQARLGGKRLKVIGIACENGNSLAARQLTAANGARELGIDYPVLVTTKGGSCPVQKWLQVQFYPTMILVDRDGRMLAREEGATDLTLARLDRAIELALSSARPSGNGQGLKR